MREGEKCGFTCDFLKDGAYRFHFRFLVLLFSIFFSF